LFGIADETPLTVYAASILFASFGSKSSRTKSKIFSTKFKDVLKIISENSEQPKILYSISFNVMYSNPKIF
jgi:hypothetical protein